MENRVFVARRRNFFGLKELNAHKWLRYYTPEIVSWLDENAIKHSFFVEEIYETNKYGIFGLRTGESYWDIYIQFQDHKDAILFKLVF